MSDYMVRATAADNQIRAFAVYTKDLTEQARTYHNTSPVATAALGRLMTGALMMGAMMKGEKDLLTLQVKGNGPMKGLTVTADAKGNVKGFVQVPSSIVPAKNGKLDVGGAIGAGFLTVIKDMGMKEPYTSSIDLQTGEIGDDLTYYFASSEQIPSSVGLGVLMDKANFVKQAGGFIIQLMPFTSEEVIGTLEQKLSGVTSVTELLEQGGTPESILEQILGDMGLEITEKAPVQYSCDCSKERFKRALFTLPKKDLQDLIAEEEDLEIVCQFCNRKYTFSCEELINRSE